MANEMMFELWENLAKIDSNFKRSLSEFESDMKDEGTRKQLWGNLSKIDPKFNRTFEDFSADMGIMSNEQTEQTETTAPLIQEEPQQKSSNANYWQSIGAPNPYPTIQKPDKEIKMSEVVRPKDYTGQSNDGSIESLLSSSFYNLSDEELSSQMEQLQKELDAPMEPVYDAFKAQTGREYDRSGKNNSHGDEVRLDNILSSMKAAELAKRGYYDANSSMRRAKIKKEVDDLFDDNSGNGKEIKERLSRLSAEKAWRERQGTGKQVMLGKALSEQQKEIQRLEESGPTNMSLRGAQKYLDDAIAEYNAPSKYGPENGFVNWAGGLGSQLSNYDTWTAGVTEMARAIDLKNIVEKMNTGKSLPPAEQAKLDAFLLYNLVQESRQEDISSAYSIGKGTAESIPFMAEMFITAGIGAAGKKLIIKSLLKKGNKEAAEKISRIFGYKIEDIAEDKAKKEVTDFALEEAKQGAIERSARQIGQDVAMTAVMPTTWTAISEDKVNKMLNGEEYGFKDFLRTFAGQTVQTGTEHLGGKIVDKALGSVMPLDKIWGKTRWGKIFTNDFIQSPLGETGEEYVGAAVNYIRSLNPMYSEKSNEELRAEAEHMFSPEGFTQTFLTVLPMSVLGGAGNVISHKKTINTYKKSKRNLISMLTELGATNEQAQTIFTSIEGSSDTQGFTEKLQYMVGALKTQYQEQHPDASLEEMEEYFNKLDKVVGDYYRSAYYLNELGGEIQSAIDNMDETEKQQVKQDFENEVKQQITNPSTTEDSDKNLEVLSTGNKPIEFKINVTEETRESGKTSDVTKEVKVSFRSNAYSLAEDGSIITERFSILENGKPLSGKKKEEYFNLINDQLRTEKAKADEKTAKEREAQAQLEQEREAQAQQIAQQKAAAEQKKKQLRETTPIKEGVVDTESSKATPAHIFLWNLDNHGQEEAIKRAARAVGESIYAKEKLEEDTKMSSTKQDAEIDRANMRIAAYEQAVKDFVGETAAQQLRQDAEGQVALLLQRDMENAKEEDRIRLERIAEKQRIKEENRKLYRTNLENSGKNNNFAQNSYDNGNNEGTNRELQESSGSGVLGTSGNGQTQSGGNQQGNEGVPSSDGLGDNQRNQGGDRAGLLSTHPDDIIDVERDANDEVSELLQKHGLSYSKHRVFQVTGELFRQTILQEKSKNPKGWMVSVHPLESDEYEVGYNDCKCYLTADGLSGVAVTPNGDIISLFSSVSKDHRMEKLIAWALIHGGKKADCYANGLQRLYARFGGKVVSQTPFVDKWAPEDWDGESRGQVVFLTFPTVEEALQTYADYKQKGIKLPEVDLSEDVVRNFPDEDNGYNQAGEYRDKVLSGEVTQEEETPKEESTSQDQDTPKEVQQEPIDLTADNVVMMVQGATATKTTYTFARHEIDKDGNDVYINLGCPFGSKLVNGNIGRKLSLKTWAVIDKSKKLFYVKDAYGTPFACYAITSVDISGIKFSRGSKLNAVVAETGEPLYGVTSMQDAYIMQGDKEVSILMNKKQHGNNIKAESIESLLKHKVIIRLASKATGEKEISVTLYDLLYGEFASDVNNFAKAREFTNVEAVNSGYEAGLYTGPLKGAIMDMAKAWNEYCSNNGLKNIKPDLSKLSQQDRDLFWFARQEMNRENREEADKASMEVQTSVPAKTMGDSNGIYNNPLHQLGVMLYIANKLGYVQGEVFNNLPGRVRQASEGKHIITKEVIEKVRERYDALKSGKATVNLDKFETEKKEIEYYEKYYPEVLNNEPAHNRLAITDDNSRKKALKNIHDSKLREEATKEVAKEEKKETPKDKSEKEPATKKKESSKEKVGSNTSVLDEIVTTGFEQLEKALADGDQTKQEEIIQQLNVIIAGNAEHQDRLAKMIADAEAKKIRAEVLKKKIAEQEKAKSETEEIDENSYNAVDAISEEVPTPTKRRKKNRQPVQVEAEKVENTLEAAPIQEAVAEPDVASETESTEGQPVTVEAVEETAVQDDTNVTFDASSLEGKSEKELKDRQSDLYLKDELQGLTKEEELELAAIKERLGGAKVYKGYEGTKQSDRNKGMSNDLAFSVSPQQRAQTARSRVLGEMMMRVLGRIKGINVHMLNSKEEVMRVLARFGIAPEFMSAYHGTDARFDKFDLSFVGNGEGAQAYGFGVYVSRNKDVARGYARQIKKSKEDDALYNKAVRGIILADDMGNLHNKSDVYGELLYGMRSIARHAMSLMTDIQDPEFKKRFGEITQENEGDMFAVIRALDSYAEEEFSILKGGKMNRLSAEDKNYIRFLAYSRMELDNYDALWQELIDFESTEDKTLADMVKFVKQKELALLYSVDIPDDTGENYLAWGERLTDEQLDKIYKAFPQFKYQVDGTPTGNTVYDALQAYIKRARGRALILFDGIPDNLLKGGKLYEELREYAEIKLPGVSGDVDEAVDYFIDQLHYGLSLGSLKEAIDSIIKQNMYVGGFQRIVGEWLIENKDRFSVNLADGFESNRLDEAASNALASLGFKGIKVSINYLNSGGRNARSDEDYNYILFNDSDVKILKREYVEYLKTPKGTIYGFAIGDDIYITQEGLNANTPIHEYTHLWVKALRSNEPKAWKKIVGELKKNKALWESVTKDEAYKDLEGDDAIASEVFARYVGDKGEALLEELAKKQKFGNEKLEKAFINRVKRSLRGFWEKILNLLVKPFGLKYNFKPKNIDEFANLTLRDLFDGKELDVEDTRINEEIESIKQKAIDNGTFMKAPNGQPSNLPEKLWLLVRTKNFKNWFGDWENNPLHASKVVDENGEPMVVYHGTGSAGFETFRLHSESDANTGSRGFFTTENRRVASVYTRDSWTETPSNAQDVILGADPHEAVYSLFMNMRNPMVVDFADENGNKRHWNEYPTNRWVVVGDEQLGMEDAEFSSEEEANEYLSQFGSSDKPIHVMLTTDDFLRKASEVGFDGCIFKNVYDGNYTIGEEMTDYVALSPNQLKSTNNKGYFSTIDDRIEYQYAEDELTQLDEHAEELIREQEEKGNAIQLDPDLSEQERESWWESVVTRVSDQSNGMRLMLNSINAYRKMKGLEPLDGDVYDVRTKFDACNRIIFNKIGFLERGIQQKLDDTIREFAEVVEDSQFYKDHKKEVGGENPTTLTPIEFIERYLIARNNWERAKEGKPRGIAEFKDRMGMGVIEFSNAFTEAYGEKVVLNLWDKIRQMTDFALDTNLEGGLISEEMHAELKAKKFYVPQRGFWDDVNGENDRENEEDILKRRTRGSRTAQNKLDSMHKAEGGKSLAEGCLAYIARDARQAIKLSEENKVKKVMFDLLRDNEDWCHEPEHGFRVPRQAFFYTDENGDIQMMDDGPTAEQVQEMRMLKNIVKQLREEYKKATTEQEREEIAAEIEETESLYPYFDEKDSWRIMHSRVSSQYGKNGLRKNKDAKKAKAIIGLYVNGVPCEIEMTPRFVRVADALNGRRDMRGEFSAIKSVTSWLSAQYTMNNPTFFAVNITRDTPYIITKGATEYGPEFSLRFTANWAVSQKAVWKYLITGEIDDTDIGSQLLDFLNNGGNTGYSNLEELQKFRNHVKDLNPGGLKMLQHELSTVEGASKVAKVLLASVGKGTVKFGDKLLGWAELRSLAQVLNEWSEIISRFSAYKSVVDMGLGINEGIKAAHNLSTNFNRRGLGAPFTNFFNSLSVFANAGIQGASGYFRTLDSQGSAAKELVKSYEKRVKELRDKYNNVTDESLKSYYDEQIRLTLDLLNSAKEYKSKKAKSIAKKVAKTAAYMGMMPAFLGFLSTMLSPDDDDKEYAPSQYERDNYIVIGDIRIALNEQLKPWWCIGVNIAQLLRGRRTLKQATNSVVTSVITNWLPVAQNIKEPISMMVDNVTSQEEWNIAQIARTAIMPSAMQSLNQWADNKNFLGGKLRYDIGDRPEYEMAPNEAALYQDLARAFYVLGGGNEKVSSKTEDDGTKLRKLWDVNPKEIKSNLFWVPSGALDVFCLGYGICKDINEKIEGDYKGTNVRVKDLPIINRFYKPNDNTLYRYAIVREVRAMVKQHNDRILNLEKQAVHFEDVLNKTGDISALESLIETNRLYDEELNDAVYTMLSGILGAYDNISIRSFQNEIGESRIEVELYHGEVVVRMNASEQELVQLMLQGRNIKKGLKHSKDVPEWIEWFDEYSPSQKESREE